MKHTTTKTRSDNTNQTTVAERSIGRKKDTQFIFIIEKLLVIFLIMKCMIVTGQLGSTGLEASTAMETPVSMGLSQDHDLQMSHHHQQMHHHHQSHTHDHPHHQQLATSTAAFHISRPCHSISTIISPPSLHQASIDILDEGSFHVSRMMLQNENFQVL